MLTDILSTIDLWIDFLEDYDEEIFITKPFPDVWSIGQVYKHLWNETTYFVSQAIICCATNQNKDLQMTSDGGNMFSMNGFPNEQIVGPPSNDHIPQPKNKQEVANDFQTLRVSLNHILDTMLQSKFEGKMPHPGLGYFNAAEWIQFADMHLRHHIRQKERIDGMVEKI